jgi:PAS domain-containing protein
MITSATWSITEDILPLIAFTGALVAILLIPVRAGGSFNVAAKTFFATSMATYLVSTLGSILDHFRLMPAGFDAVVTSVELLWVPLILFGVYAMYSHQQLTDSVDARRSVVRASAMLESVMDTAPAGVVVLNDIGAITFANPEARRLLDMEEEPLAEFTDPKWSVCIGDDSDGSLDRRCDFGELLGAEPLRNVSVTVSWPNGWRRRLAVNTTPFVAASGSVSGAVAAFVEREPWSPPVRAAAARSPH